MIKCGMRECLNIIARLIDGRVTTGSIIVIPLDKKTGIFSFYRINFDQEEGILFSIGLEELLDSFDEEKKIRKFKELQNIKIFEAKQKMQLDIMKAEMDSMKKIWAEEIRTDVK